MSYVIEIANDRNGRLTAVEIVFFLRPHHRDSPTYRCRDRFFGCTINTIINCTTKYKDQKVQLSVRFIIVHPPSDFYNQWWIRLNNINSLYVLKVSRYAGESLS